MNRSIFSKLPKELRCWKHPTQSLFRNPRFSLSTIKNKNSKEEDKWSHRSRRNIRDPTVVTDEQFKKDLKRAVEESFNYNVPIKDENRFVVYCLMYLIGSCLVWLSSRIRYYVTGIDVLDSKQFKGVDGLQREITIPGLDESDADNTPRKFAI
mmetsp:Transcript_13582/g.15044  ORF Transcript_13582/g.15044 Transcript_13582/m.15044 type:complete len:153 (+) Transcript_13582:114-572(+)